MELLLNARLPECLTKDFIVATNMHDYESNDEELSQTFAKMLESFEKGIGPHEEVVEIINLGTEEDKKEV